MAQQIYLINKELPCKKALVTCKYFISVTSLNPYTGPVRYEQGGYPKCLIIGMRQAIRTDADQYAILVYTRAQDRHVKIYQHFIDKIN